MSELAFAKSFLSALDSRPIKLRADYVHSEETPRAPYLLPRLQPPRPEMPKKTKKSSVPGSAKAISVTLKSARNPVLEVNLPNAPLSTTTVSDLKDAIRDRIVDNSDNRVSLDKIKILYKKKPVTGTGKTVAEVVRDAGEDELLSGGGSVEFGVMVMGGARVVEGGGAEGQEENEGQVHGHMTGASETTAKAAVGPSGQAVLETEQFWDDLQGYLGQRLKDAEEAERLRGLFKEAWISSRST
ncbi:cell-cycle control medial ring component [Aspergillus egyptiacus]|nr:cell-cycle control medial ring component [Aspergillus egyptiacus]